MSGNSEHAAKAPFDQLEQLLEIPPDPSGCSNLLGSVRFAQNDNTRARRFIRLPLPGWMDASWQTPPVLCVQLDPIRSTLLDTVFFISRARFMGSALCF
jgi:hypothetical protein